MTTHYSRSKTRFCLSADMYKPNMGGMCIYIYANPHDRLGCKASQLASFNLVRSWTNSFAHKLGKGITNNHKAIWGGETTRVFKKQSQQLYFDNTLFSNHPWCPEPLKQLKQRVTTYKATKLGVDEISHLRLQLDHVDCTWGIHY